jgi:hypothetical protein
VAHLEASRSQISIKLLQAFAIIYLLGFSKSHSSILANLPRTTDWQSARAFLQAYCKKKHYAVTYPERIQQAKHMIS